jgi:hypothetical protein
MRNKTSRLALENECLGTDPGSGLILNDCLEVVALISAKVKAWNALARLL